MDGQWERTRLRSRACARLCSAELGSQEAIDFLRREDAYAEREEIPRDEPEWAGTLFVASIELDERHVSSN